MQGEKEGNREVGDRTEGKRKGIKEGERKNFPFGSEEDAAAHGIVLCWVLSCLDCRLV